MKRDFFEAHIRQQLQPMVGLQSQHRGSSIQKAKKAAAGRKKKVVRQSGIFGRRPFIQLEDCRVCKMKLFQKEGRSYPPGHKHAGQLVKVPHVSHHKKCPENRKTRGLSARTVEVERIADANIRTNNIPPASLGPTMGTTAEFKRAFLCLAPVTLPSNVAAAVQEQDNNEQERSSASTTIADLSKPDELALELRLELEKRLSQLEDSASLNHHRLATLVRQCPAPRSVALLFDYIFSQTTVKYLQKGTTEARSIVLAEGLKNRHRFFPGSNCIFEIPSDMNSPNLFPQYHALEGRKFFILDWEAMFPSMELKCPGCEGVLQRGRSNFSHHRTLFPVFEPNGMPMWGSVMNYKCERCDQIHPANSGAILASLPYHVASKYPVEAKYAASSARFHLSIDTMDELDSRMLSVASGESLSKKLFACQGKQWQRLLQSYISKAGPDSPNFDVEFHEFVGKWAPSGQQLRDYYNDGEHCSLNPYGYSNYDRYNRELQSVGRGDSTEVGAVAIDWTFAALKTYIKLDKAKAIFTMKTTGGLTALLAIVPSTKVSQISHLLTQLIHRRPQFRPRILYTDQWPVNEEFWKNIFGESIIGRLGLFHVMKRITDTFQRVDESLFGRVMEQLKACFYRYHSEDYDKLLSALRNGQINGESYSDNQIIELQRSKRWNQRYSVYLRKFIHFGHEIQLKLAQLIIAYKYAEDSEGKRIFAPKTEDVIIEQYNNLQYVGDPEGFSPYREVVRSRTTSNNGLTKWESNRLESALEKFHHVLANFGNTGMGTSLADALLMRGTTEDNSRIYYRDAEKIQGVPSHFEMTPPFWDHSLLWHINASFEDKGLKPMFSYVRQPMPDNGEVFLSTYHTQQVERNAKCADRSDAFRCGCPTCENVEFPLVGTTTTTTRTTTTTPSHATNAPMVVTAAADTTSLVSDATTNAPRASCTNESVESVRAAPQNQDVVPATAPRPLPLPPCNSYHLATAHHPTFVPWATTPFGASAHVSFATSLPSATCFPYPPFYCQKRRAYNQECQEKRKAAGRPPHDTNCSIAILRKQYQFHSNY